MTEKFYSKEEIDRLQYIDNREYQAKFLLDPDVFAEEDFKHLDKNLAITNLKDNPKLHIDEVSEARSILRGLHILNNLKHYKETEKVVLIGHNKTKNSDGTTLLVPVYEKRKVLMSRYPKTFHSLKSEFIGLVNTTAARNGHRMKSAITNRLEKVESLQEKTTPQSKWGFSKKDR